MSLASVYTNRPYIVAISLIWTEFYVYKLESKVLPDKKFSFF
jgi:hypothetical protein